MPKISQKCEYGLRTVLELTHHQGRGPVSVSQIAAVQAIPQRFLELIVRELREAGVLTSHRGARGGYTLAADPQHLTVGQVVRLLDGPLSPMDCMACGGERYCALQGACAFDTIWAEAAAALAGVYDAITFEQLARRAPSASRPGARPPSA
ncbi:MAG: RrF2 family transcriptional regulator [Planctomycetota bacterium]|jgi:Rrf2 family protein